MQKQKLLENLILLVVQKEIEVRDKYTISNNNSLILKDKYMYIYI